MVVVYEDEYVCLTDFSLEIKNYHFPSKKPKLVNIDAITIIWFEERDTCRCSSTKTWGKSPANIYWALDVKRCLSTTPSDRWNVVLDVGTKQRVGFTVENCETFMDAMRTHLDNHVIIVDSINL